MLLNPAIMALILVSLVVTLMALLASVFALQVVSRWDIGSGSQRQLELERRTYLISTLLTWAFASELISLLLFVYNAESMSGQFVGAMCATGVLNVNGWGWPTLLLKITIFFSGTTWLALNYLDNQGYDYPLVKLKYSLLLLIVPLVIAEFITQWLFFTNMSPDVITSCCGALFSANAQGVAAEVSGVKPGVSMVTFYGTGFAVLASGAWYALKQRGGLLFALFSSIAFITALVAIVSLVSLYIYEHPNHHCPFCILKSGHGYAGYLLYVPLFLATAVALGAGTLSPWKKIPSLTAAVSRHLPRWSWLAVALFGLFYLLATGYMLRSNLVITGGWW